MASHSSVLAWRIPGTAEPGGLPSMGSHRVGHDWSHLAAAAAGTAGSWGGNYEFNFSHQFWKCRRRFKLRILLRTKRWGFSYVTKPTWSAPPSTSPSLVTLTWRVTTGSRPAAFEPAPPSAWHSVMLGPFMTGFFPSLRSMFSWPFQQLSYPSRLFSSIFFYFLFGAY